MSLQHLDGEHLSLNIDQVKRRVTFLRAYARACLDDLEAMRSPNSPQTGSNELAGWDAHADAASSLAEAAQLAVIYDSRLAADLFDASGQLFIQLGHPYGIYLRAVANRWNPREHFELFANGLRTIEILQGLQPIDPASQPIPRPWHAVQQQIYFLLALTGSPTIRSDFRERLARLAEASPLRRGVAPTGALGTALHRLWDITVHFLMEPRTDTAASVIAEHLTAMSTAYDERMRLAMVNEYMWFHAASPVNLGDIEILGISALASRTLSTGAFVSQMRQRMEQLSPLARVPAELGIEMAADLKREG
jgi:hypothetical protein